MQVISYKSIPKIILKEPQRIRRAMAKTLNTIAFDSLPEITDRAKKDMNFRRDARRAMGFRVSPKATPTNIEAHIWSDRGRLAYHIDDGRRSADDGWKFNGRSFILVPVEKKAFTAKGRLKSGFRKGIYIVPDGTDALIFYRARRGDRRSTLIGVLKPQVKYNEDTRPDRVINNVFIKKANRLFNFYLDRE